jgi:hypothetical protein
VGSKILSKIWPNMRELVFCVHPLSARDSILQPLSSKLSSAEPMADEHAARADVFLSILNFFTVGKDASNFQRQTSDSPETVQVVHCVCLLSKLLFSIDQSCSQVVTAREQTFKT